MVGSEKVDIPASKLKEEMVRILHEEGFIKGYKFIDDRKQGILRVYLKYGSNKEKIISGLKRISKPGRRIYVTRDKVPNVLGGLGIAILSTPKGIMTSVRCRKEKVGGEVLCYIW
jgi:small subunit ribosomal protein S8